MENKLHHCPACFCTKLETIQKDLFDDRYGYPGGFTYLKCFSCSHVFVENFLEENSLVELYTNFYNRSKGPVNLKSESTNELSSLSLWLNGDKSSPSRWVQEPGKVLDIGCGYGSSLVYLESKGCQVEGIDADKNVEKVARENNLNIRVGVFCKTDYKKEYFDAVIMSQVLEHCLSPRQTLNDVGEILKPGGLCILSIPNYLSFNAFCFGRKWIHWHSPYHQHFFSRDSLKAFLKDSVFEIESTHSVTPSSWLYFQFLHILFYPKMGKKSSFWVNDYTSISFGQKVLFRLVNVLFRTKLFHVLTRCMDIINRGDNLILVLRKQT